TKAFNIAPAFV
ncbi:hypothetical protein D030_4493B, partial [Vibrio parahaemolyticus AQ3810]